uniref:Mucin-2 n=1 Tax=Ditylenchus dipsaci TaxID=166011 RepID=A0A915ES30_9BILA
MSDVSFRLKKRLVKKTKGWTEVNRALEAWLQHGCPQWEGNCDKSYKNGSQCEYEVRRTPICGPGYYRSGGDGLNCIFEKDRPATCSGSHTTSKPKPNDQKARSPTSSSKAPKPTKTTKSPKSNLTQKATTTKGHKSSKPTSRSSPNPAPKPTVSAGTSKKPCLSNKKQTPAQNPSTQHRKNPSNNQTSGNFSSAASGRLTKGSTALPTSSQTDATTTFTRRKCSSSKHCDWSRTRTRAPATQSSTQSKTTKKPLTKTSIATAHTASTGHVTKPFTKNRSPKAVDPTTKATPSPMTTKKPLATFSTASVHTGSSSHVTQSFTKNRSPKAVDPTTEAPIACPKNEYYSKCPQCAEWQCKNIKLANDRAANEHCADGNGTHCPYKAGCYCNLHHARNDQGNCVPNDQCHQKVTVVTQTKSVPTTTKCQKSPKPTSRSTPSPAPTSTKATVPTQPPTTKMPATLPAQPPTAEVFDLTTNCGICMNALTSHCRPSDLNLYPCCGQILENYEDTLRNADLLIIYPVLAVDGPKTIGGFYGKDVKLFARPKDGTEVNRALEAWLKHGCPQWEGNCDKSYKNGSQCEYEVRRTPICGPGYYRSGGDGLNCIFEKDRPATCSGSHTTSKPKHINQKTSIASKVPPSSSKAPKPTKTTKSPKSTSNLTQKATTTKGQKSSKPTSRSSPNPAPKSTVSAGTSKKPCSSSKKQTPAHNPSTQHIKNPSKDQTSRAFSGAASGRPSYPNSWPLTPRSSGRLTKGSTALPTSSRTDATTTFTRRKCSSSKHCDSSRTRTRAPVSQSSRITKKPPTVFSIATVHTGHTGHVTQAFTKTSSPKAVDPTTKDPIACPKNEYYSRCPQCAEWQCKNIKLANDRAANEHCADGNGTNCPYKAGCYCNLHHARNDQGKCVPNDLCHQKVTVVTQTKSVPTTTKCQKSPKPTSRSTTSPAPTSTKATVPTQPPTTKMPVTVPTQPPTTETVPTQPPPTELLCDKCMSVINSHCRFSDFNLYPCCGLNLQNYKEILAKEGLPSLFPLSAKDSAKRVAGCERLDPLYRYIQNPDFFIHKAKKIPQSTRESPAHRYPALDIVLKSVEPKT